MRNYLVLLMLTSLIAIAANTIAGAQDDDTTILWYKFDVPFNNEVEDRSPHGNHGQISGDVELEEDGRIGGAARFTNGTSINVPISDTLNPPESLTIEFWVWCDKVPAATYWRLVHKGWVAAASYICGMDNNWMTRGYTWDINSKQNVRKDANKENVALDETWQYYSATYDGEEIILWIDGEPAVTTAAEGEIDGKFPIIIAETFSGMLDEIRFSSAALSQEEIQAHMEGEDVHAVKRNGKLAMCWGGVKGDIR